MSPTRAAPARPSPSSPPDPARAAFAADLREHLAARPRRIPARWLYDHLGSALFEAICHLPWYGITRAEGRLLAAHRGEIARRLGPLATVVELGPGSGHKLRTLLGASGLTTPSATVHLVDLSPGALEAARRTLAERPGLRVLAHHASYEDGLAVARSQPGPGGPALVLFLGSNIGNFDPSEARAFLRVVRRQLRAGDALLLGADLVKPEARLLLAYDDPLGLTAAFNKNLLLRANRELDGDFDLAAYAHEARWSGEHARVEMHLVARTDQRVHVAGAELELDLAAGESIWTESSYKYRPEDVDALLEGSGFAPEARWTDAGDAFALTLARAE